MTYLHKTAIEKSWPVGRADRNSLANRGRVLRGDQPLNSPLSPLPAFYLFEDTDFVIVSREHLAFSFFSFLSLSSHSKNKRATNGYRVVENSLDGFFFYTFSIFGNLRFASIREKAITELRETLFGIIETFLNTFYCLVSRKSNDLS